MEQIAVDVGSGMTKIRGGASETPLYFPSVVGGFTESQRGFLVDPMVFESKSSRLVRAGRYLFGTQAEALTPPDQRANTLSADWSGSDAWGVLLLVSIAALHPKGFSGEVEIATGVPQAIYSTRRDDVLARMAGQHDFTVGDAAYSVQITPHVLPQAAAAVLSSDDLGSTVGARGVIDVGTFTTGMAVVYRKSQQEAYSVQYWRCGGIEVGVSKVSGMISDAITREFGGKPEEAAVHAAILSKKMFIRGQEVDISKMVDHAINTVSSQIVEAVSRLWPHGAMDLVSIDLVGGGAPLVVNPMKEAFPQSRMVKSPQWSIVDGLYRAVFSSGGSEHHK